MLDLAVLDDFVGHTLERLDGMAKPMPMEPAESEEVAVEAIEELMPITWPAALKVGPPELPG